MNFILTKDMYLCVFSLKIKCWVSHISSVYNEQLYFFSWSKDNVRQNMLSCLTYTKWWNPRIYNIMFVSYAESYVHSKSIYVWLGLGSQVGLGWVGVTDHNNLSIFYFINLFSQNTGTKLCFTAKLSCFLIYRSLIKSKQPKYIWLVWILHVILL